MVDDGNSVDSAVLRAESVSRRANVSIGLFLVSILVLVAELAVDVAPIDAIPLAVPAVVLFFIAGSMATKKDDARKDVVESLLSSADRCCERAVDQADDNEFERARTTADDAEAKVERATEYANKISDDDTKSKMMDRTAAGQSVVERTRERIAFQETRADLADPVREIVAKYESAGRAIEEERFDDVVDELENIDALEAEVESELAPFDDLLEDDGENATETPTSRIRAARDEFADRVASQVKRAVRKHDDGTTHLAAGRYEEAIQSLDDAAAILDGVRRVFEASELPYIDDIVVELADEPCFLQTLPSIGEYRAEQLASAGFQNRADLERASRSDLMDAKGIGEHTADRIKQYLGKFSIQQPIGDRQASIGSDRDRALERRVDEICEPVEAPLETVDDHLTEGEIRDAEQSLAMAETELEGVVDRLETAKAPETQSRVEQLREAIDDRRTDIELARDGVEVLSNIDGTIETSRDAIGDGQFDEAMMDLKEARSKCQDLTDGSGPYPTTDEIRERSQEIDDLVATIEAKEAKEDIEAIIERCRTILDKADRVDTYPEVRERIESKTREARDRLDDLQSDATEFDERLEKIETRMASYERRKQQSGDESEDDSENDQEQISEAIEDVAAVLGRMPKRNEFLDRSEWGQADVTAAFESWTDALESANIDVEEELLAELERVGEAVDGEPSSLDMNRHGAYSAAKYSSHFGSWAEAVAAADIEITDTDEGSDEVTSSDEPSDSPSKGDTDQPDDVASYVTFADVPLDSRFQGELAVEVVSTEETDRKKDARLTVRDAASRTATFNVWTKHGCEVEWDENEWYVLSEVRLKEWERNGETYRTLSSSRDMSVVALEKISHGEGDSSGGIELRYDDKNTARSDEKSTDDERVGDESEEADSDEDEETDVLDSIVSEFDDELV